MHEPTEPDTGARHGVREARGGEHRDRHAATPAPAGTTRTAGLLRHTLRRLLRPLLGRDRAVWRWLRAPRLRHAAFRSHVDCVVYGLLVARGRVFGVQIGSNDGRSGDPLWAFRRYPGWSAVLVEPLESAFRRLKANYAPWADRFTFVRAAIAGDSGRRPLFHLYDDGSLPPGWDQLGTLDEELLREHVRRLCGDAGGLRITARTVRCMTFRELCDRHDVGSLDLLHIDAEGLDLDILRQVDFARLRPAVVLYETAHLSASDRTAARTLLGDAGYAIRSAGDDTIAVRRDALAGLPALHRAWRVVSRRPLE